MVFSADEANGMVSQAGKVQPKRVSSLLSCRSAGDGQRLGRVTQQKRPRNPMYMMLRNPVNKKNVKSVSYATV